MGGSIYAYRAIWHRISRSVSPNFDRPLLGQMIIHVQADYCFTTGSRGTAVAATKRHCGALLLVNDRRSKF